jgi:hypothetical protein
MRGTLSEWETVTLAPAGPRPCWRRRVGVGGGAGALCHAVRCLRPGGIHAGAHDRGDGEGNGGGHALGGDTPVLARDGRLLEVGEGRELVTPY